MIQSRQIGTLTEIYVESGYITESFPTNFHTFCTRKILLDSIDNYKEVTEAEKTKLEESDAKWERPPQAFIDQWNRECEWNWKPNTFGKYNEETGYFELNGLTDISYREAMRIWNRSACRKLPYLTQNLNIFFAMFGAGGMWNESVEYSLCRTYFPIILSGGYAIGRLMWVFKGNSKLEVVSFVGGYGTSVGHNVTLLGTFGGCGKLREIKGNIAYPILDSETFASCLALEELNISLEKGSTVDLHWSPKLSFKSLKLLVNNSRNDAIVYLHQEAYDRITEELFAKAAEKNITIATK